jgi:hypothetical protein
MPVQTRQMKRHQTNQQSGTPKKLRLIPNVSSAKKRKTQKNQSVSPTKKMKMSRTASKRHGKTMTKIPSKQAKLPMNKTRKQRIYKNRVKDSACRGKKPYACAATSGCKVASGEKRTFCRKEHNVKV